jgi:hypothetical protein
LNTKDKGQKKVEISARAVIVPFQTPEIADKLRPLYLSYALR